MTQTLFIKEKFYQNNLPKFFAILLLGCIFCNSCSKSSKDQLKDNIVGKWYVTADTARSYTWPGNQFIENLQTNITTSTFLQFNADGTVVSHISDTNVSNFTYVISGNKLIYHIPASTYNGLQFPASTDTTIIKSLTTTNMVLYNDAITPPNGGIRYRTTDIGYYTKK